MFLEGTNTVVLIQSGPSSLTDVLKAKIQSDPNLRLNNAGYLVHTILEECSHDMHHILQHYITQVWEGEEHLGP